jgi:large subunit ribosomal protein L17
LQRFTVIDGGGDDAKKVDLIEKVFVELAQRYKGRPGGYTRITKVGNRRGDNAPISIIELVAADEPKKAKKAAKKPAAEKPAPAKKAAPAEKPEKAEKKEEAAEG